MYSNDKMVSKEEEECKDSIPDTMNTDYTLEAQHMRMNHDFLVFAVVLALLNR